MIGVIDFGAGNTRSVLRALAAVGAEASLVGEGAEMSGCDRIVLPGVGAAGTAVAEMHRRGQWQPVRGWALDGRPLLAVCLGAQLLLDHSEEDDTAGLGIIGGVARAFPSPAEGGPEQVPHIGWNAVEMVGGGSAEAYFVHGYWLDPSEPGVVVATTQLGGFSFPSLLRRGAITATQFHPEKSGPFGRALLAAFSAGLLDATGARQWS